MTVQAVTLKKIIYDTLTGEIVSRVSYSAYEDGNDAEPQLPAGCSIKDGDSHPDTYYIVNGVDTLRPDMPLFSSVDTIIANDVDTVLFDSVPVGTKVIVNDATEYQIDDGVFEYSTGNPGMHKFRFIKFPYVTEDFYVNAS